MYKESKRLAVLVHKLSMSFPKFEMFEEGSQIRRSSKAVTSAIVLGYSLGRYKADFVGFLVYAKSDCNETIVHFDFLYETESFKDENMFTQLKNEYELLGKRINEFIQWVEDNLNDFAKPAPSNRQPETGNQL